MGNYDISRYMRDTLSTDTAYQVLVRADMLTNSVLEQLRKSTDRAYTLFSIFVTAFSGIGAFGISSSSMSLRLFCAILCFGLGLSCLLLFVKVLWVHHYVPIGNEAEVMLYDDNMKMLEKVYNNNAQKMNAAYMRNFLLDNIEDTTNAYRTNNLLLERRSMYVRWSMLITLTSVIIAFFLLLIFYILA
ncbi:hypothetical protein [Prevotella pallens]|jgi:hypothetical protein|uniref:hypothetical protein n=2 Tax=Prevotella pallens TaxID=60133 RepID=UPI001CAD1215|nr:hypothetical protein [Prevotella pallens]MBF1517453.1 hypothetical protein [Prevotella pallens]DAR39590.1 MAG TPA: hypothetical protein [Caudoviricetes sp.]